MIRYDVVKVIAGYVVFDNINRVQSQIYSYPDAEALRAWLHSRWAQGRS